LLSEYQVKVVTSDERDRGNRKFRRNRDPV